MAKNQPKPSIKQTPPPQTTVASLAAQPAGSSFDYANIIYMLLLFVAFVCSYQYIHDSKIHLGGDNAEYYILAKALLEGKGYTYIANLVALPHNHFPPGYPFLLSILMRIVGTDQATLTAFNGAFLLGALYILFNLFKRASGNIHLAFVVCATCLLNFHLMQFSTIMMSEIPFLFFASLSLWCFVQIDLANNPLKERFFYPFIALLVAAFYIRTAGLSLVAGILLYLLLQKNWKYLAATAVSFFALVLPWQLRSRALGGSSYGKQLMMINPYKPESGAVGAMDMVMRFGHNVVRYFAREVPAGLFPWLEHDPNDAYTSSEWVIGAIILAAIIFGLYKLKNYRTLFIGYTLGSFGILLLWPDVWFGVRFVLPLLPFLWFFFGNGVYESLKWLADKTALKGGFVVAAALPFVLFAFTPKWMTVKRVKTEMQGKEQVQYEEFAPCMAALHANREQDYEPKYKNYFDLAQWVADNTPKESVICCRKQGLFYLTANRYVTGFKNTTDINDLLKDLQLRKVNYVLLDQLGFADVGRYLYPAIMANPKQFQIIQQRKDPDTFLLKYDPTQPAGNGAAPSPTEGGAQTSTRPPQRTGD
jgi:branched-subunit amino acid transport protein AzlD